MTKARVKRAILFLLGTASLALLGAYVAFGSSGVRTAALDIPSWSVPYVSGGRFEPDSTPSDATKPFTLIESNGGEWTKDPSVTLVASRGTQGAPLAKTLYVIENGPVSSYTKPISLVTEGVTRVDFWSVDVEGTREVTRTAYVGFDSHPPVTTCSAIDGASYTSEARITLDATDTLSGVSSIYYALDDDEGSTDGLDGAAATIVASLGTHTLEYYSVDQAGNEETHQVVHFSVTGADITPPECAANVQSESDDQYGDGSWTRTVTLTFDATDGRTGDSGIREIRYARSQYDLAGTVYANPVEFATQGRHTVWFWAVDGAGNVSARQSVTFGVDNDAPTARDDHVNEYTTGTAAITLSGTDPAPAPGVPVAGIDHLTYRLNEEVDDSGDPQYHEIEAPGVVVSTHSGLNTLDYYAVDAAGNASAEQHITFTVSRSDSTPPVSSISGLPVAGAWATAPVHFTVTASDAGSSQGIASYGIAWNTSDAFDLSAMPDYPDWATAEGTLSAEGNPRKIYYFSVDHFGNVEAPRLATVRVDLFAPVVWSDVADKTFYGSVTPKLTAMDTASGVKSITYTIDGARSKTTAGSHVTLAKVGSAGRHTIVFTAVDNAGHMSAARTTRFVVSLPKATVSTPSAPSSVVHGRKFTITGYVAPKHASGTYLVTLRLYLQDAQGVYKYRSSVTARRYPYNGSKSKYSASVTLSQKGKWYVVAVHADSGHASSTSAPRYITSK